LPEGDIKWTSKENYSPRRLFVSIIQDQGKDTMKRLLPDVALSIVVLSACSSHVKYLRENPDRLTRGLKAKAFLKVWGEPDETLAYHKFLNTYGHRVSGQLDSDTGTESVSRYGDQANYTHETVVWIYKKQKKILFLEKGYLVRDAPGALRAVWRLVGWETLPEPPKDERAVKSLKSPRKTYQRHITYADGSQYLGGVLDGKRHGQGTYIWPSGGKYVGEWRNNIAIGGWFYKTTGRKVWVYQDSEGRWIVAEQ
jgi:hypothetical protein